MNSTPSETTLQSGCRELHALTQATHLPLERLAPAAESLLNIARALAEPLRLKAVALPALRDYLAARAEPSALSSDVPIVLYGNATEADVRFRWAEQLRAIARGIVGVYDNEKPFLNEWLYRCDMEGDRKPGEAFFRAQQIRDSLKEIVKLCALLQPGRKALRISRGTRVFADDFTSLAAWKKYGAGDATVSNGRMTIAGEGITVWCQKDFGDAVLSIEYEPSVSAGTTAGTLFAFPARPHPGNTEEISAGAMSNYNLGVDTYHCSLYRGSSGRTNLRRAGLGLKMCSTVMPDACEHLGRRYHLEFVKLGQTVQVHVDGKLIHAYVDTGTYGAPPARGRLCIRHFAGHVLQSLYNSFEIAEVQTGEGTR
jgi:hypothetical protein